ncbi:hypothetical protein [Luteimicrobium subarcticum]|uniref:Uncharacterized protein n=1 Tax=Luteimicrobium subarcticum TaxID=620910 RepID=A0A2M8WJ64_9MICO|nr:hypothetical protein [Luteimicrobium subarcticum]PJI90926.1 hypothetical protein CLV34_2182 [Luteimicrobium subarcticum]
MSRTRTATYSPAQTARRAAVKQATAELCAHLRSYGAKAATGRLSPERGTAKVTLPGSRVRVDVEVTVPSLSTGTGAGTGTGTRYGFTDPATGDALVTDSVREVRRLLAPTPSPVGRVVWRTFLVTLVAAILIALVTAPREDTKHFLASHWLPLVGIVVVLDLVIVGGLELRRARRRRRAERTALTQLGGVVRR